MSVTNEQAVALAEKDAEIARQWIDYLKKKNTHATILWVVFLVWALAATGFAFFSYAKQLELSAQEQVLQQNNTAENQALLAQLGQQKQRLAEQEQKLTAQAEALSKMSMSSGEAGEQLVLTTQLAETLKQKVAQLEQDNSLLEDALAKSNKAMAQVKSDKSASKKALEEKTGMLDARAQAYSALVKRQKETKAEMERLADALATQNAERDDLAKRNATLSKELSQVLAKSDAQSEELASLKQAHQGLQQRLKNLTSPIADAGVQSSSASKGTSESAAMREAHSRAIQPIVPQARPIAKPIEAPNKAAASSQAESKNSAQNKPKTKQAPSALDFESIAIE